MAVVGDCIPYSGRLNSNGYGNHRLAYERQVGPIPEGMELDHLCKRRDCVNPQHLEPVTPSENRRRSSLGQDPEKCREGHVYDEANTYVRGAQRYCRPFRARNARRLRARRRAAAA